MTRILIALALAAVALFAWGDPLGSLPPDLGWIGLFALVGVPAGLALFMLGRWSRG